MATQVKTEREDLLSCNTKGAPPLSNPGPLARPWFMGRVECLYMVCGKWSSITCQVDLINIMSNPCQRVFDETYQRLISQGYSDVVAVREARLERLSCLLDDLRQDVSHIDDHQKDSIWPITPWQHTK